MALSVAPSTRVFNGNASRQGYNVSSSCKGSKCLCCPYGYHIDLDFVRYCEAVAAGSTSDRSTLERRKKRERRRQCQSMEVLLGLVSPALAGLEAQLPKVSQECATTNGVITTLPRSNYVRTGTSTQYSPGLDLSDVVGDFEDTLRRSSKSSFTSSRQHETDGTNVATPMQNVAQPESGDFDNASIGSGNSNLSTGALQNIREQMAVSLERMRDLEEQVKAIPMLQIQLSVLKEEKRNLLRQIDELTRTNAEQEALQRHRTRSFSENRRYNSANSIVSTRDMGTMCGAMTRDVGVSHRQIRTRDFGMVTSTPIKISEATEETKTQTSWDSLKSSCSPSMWKPSKLMSLSRSELVLGNISPEMKRKILLKRSPLQLESIAPKELEKSCESVKKKLRDFGTNTYPQVPKPRLERSELLIEEILPEIPQKVEIKKRSCGVTTYLRMRDVIVPDQLASTVENALEDYINREKHHKGVQCQPEVISRRDAHVQTAEQFKMRSNVGVTAKPRTSEIGVDVKMTTAYRTVAVGPDPVSTQPVSLNSMNSRSHSFNYGDTKPKRKTTKSVGVHVEDLIKTSSRGTDTSSLLPKKREFGTSPIKKKFADVSVGESVRTHISISCTANYCDNCKETIKNLAKQISMNENNHHQNTVTNVSRIPRPAHINLSTDNRKPFKRQDTYTKIPTSGVIKYDADNKEQYENSNRLEELKTEQVKDEKSVSEESTQLIIKNEEKQQQQQQQHHHHPTILPETALFQPIQDKPRKKVEPSKEMRAAMKVLNDNLKKSPSKNISHQIKNATNVIQQEWFKMSSTADANPLDIEDYLDCFEECSGSLLEYVVNMTDSSGNTAMHYAVSHGNFDVVSILLDSKVCDINKANVAGYTAVMLAALVDVRNSTHASVANRLFQLADVNIRAKLHGQTALMLAVSHGRKDMTELLLNAGAAINIQDEDGSTALMCAAEHGHTDIVRLLLSHPDCDSSIVDIDGSSALKIALEAGNRDIGVLLYAHERVNRGTSPYSSMRKSRRGSKPTTPTGPSPSAPVSPAPSRKLHSSNLSLNSSKYSSKQ